MITGVANVPSHVPVERAIHFDFRNDDALRRDPWGYINAMNDKPDIFYSPDLGGHWVVTRGEMIAEVFSRHDLFTAKSLVIPKIENPYKLIPNSFDPPTAHWVSRDIRAESFFAPRLEHARHR